MPISRSTAIARPSPRSPGSPDTPNQESTGSKPSPMGITPEQIHHLNHLDSVEEAAQPIMSVSPSRRAWCQRWTISGGLWTSISPGDRCDP